MQKFKKGFIYLLGAVLAFLSKYTGAYAQNQTLYGVAAPRVQYKYGIPGMPPEATTGEKILAIILSPVFWITVTGSALIVGIVLYLISRSKRKNVKKDS